ncbi:MAG TPA: PRTRC system protein C [Methanosarcina sp.]|nr:PRTRC system protein C [Methanosarcina sp.]
MATTTVIIPGTNDITVPFAMSVEQVKDFLSEDYQQINGMDVTSSTDEDGNVTVTFRQRTGTKGE